MKLTMYWTAKGRQTCFYQEICKKFGITQYMSVNYETTSEIWNEDLPLLRECEKRGFIQIRNKQ